MTGSLVRKSLLAGLALSASLGAVGCGTDNNPYGPPFLDQFASVIGAYRPAELLVRRNPFVDGQFVPPSDGSDIRFSFGSTFTMAGRVFVPGGAPGGGDMDERFSGRWSYDVPAQRVIVDLDPGVAISPPRLVFTISFDLDRVYLDATTDVAGIPLTLELAKPLPPADAPSSGCFNCVSFDEVRGR